MATLGIDPGTQLAGWSILHGTITDAGIVRVPKAMARKPLAVRIYYMLAELRAALGQRMPLVTQVVVEMPRVYPKKIGDKKKGPKPNDLVDLSTVAGAFLSTYAPSLGSARVTPYGPYPRQWKGTVPKDIHNARMAERFPEAVPLIEAAATKSFHNHIWDAVGLAAYGEDQLKCRNDRT